MKRGNHLLAQALILGAVSAGPRRDPIRCARRLAVSAITAITVLGTGCGSVAAPPDPQVLLGDARHSVDITNSLRFRLTSANAVGSGPLLLGGSGEVRRPDNFTGSLQVSIDGLLVSVEAVSVAGAFYVRLPLRANFERTRPAAYGFSDPATMLDAHHGMSSLLTAARSVSLRPRDRLEGEELEEIQVSLPNAEVAALLPLADHTSNIQATFGITTAAHQLRRAVMAGPFFDAHRISTYSLLLDNYGTAVSVTVPPS